MNNTYSVWYLPKTDDENGYWLSRACVESSGIKDFEAALADAGGRINCNGGLMAIVIAGYVCRLVHFNGFSGEWTITKNAADMRKHLKTLGMKLLGNFKG